ncbi:DNA alkylation repair protein [Sulfitobacter sp. G21635-S1]|uniref:DNA alkylation repair protein n=1 Tax=Sulfitobacter sp. G21635-S1 TaxID=3014043 RepID=UPI0022AF476C|nr:DNA alkylation repair protein [Sulfitobacter sp. G21635-S1]MCZ4258115.1 DNA alkylation repair protein [Sulfitobacter sp. G21635-S1]
MAEPFSLKDHLFNAESIGELAEEYAAGLPGFDAARFQQETLAGFPERALMERLDWIADCLEPHLAADFPTMAEQLEAMMPPPLDPRLRDDDFGRFIHAVPGILAVRHGLENHRERALDLIHAATRRFSMEYYIRPFLNRWPEQTLARLSHWVEDDNYHVRRLVSEGTRPRLPWARAVTLTSDQTLPLLDRLHADPTRYVSRSVANHLNDIAKKEPDRVVNLLLGWEKSARQDGKELAWMTRHALRTLIKQGDAAALDLLGYRRDVPVTAQLTLEAQSVAIGGALAFSLQLEAPQDLPVMVDYRLRFARPGGKEAEKVFKLKATQIAAGQNLSLRKSHKLKGDATTFTLHPGKHGIIVQVNGVDVAEAQFDLTAA